MINHILLIAAFLCIGSPLSAAQTLPKEVRRLIDAEFRHWNLEVYRTPDSARFPNASFVLSPYARTVIKCRLNRDSRPDYAIRISLVDSTGPCEYTLAAISRGRSFRLFRVDSSLMRYQDQMFLSRAGQYMNTFGDPDSAILRYGQLSDDKEFIRFPTDCIFITPIVESSHDLNYVFIDDKFYQVISGD